MLKLLGVTAIASPIRAWKPNDVRAVLAYVSSALANGNPSDALTVFAKDCPGFNKLVEYFSALTRSYGIASEVEITDETNSGNEIEVEANWILTLTSLTTQISNRRSQKVRIHFRDEGPAGRKNWKIVEFSPIDLFDPYFK